MFEYNILHWRYLLYVTIGFRLTTMHIRWYCEIILKIFICTVPEFKMADFVLLYIVR